MVSRVEKNLPRAVVFGGGVGLDAGTAAALITGPKQEEDCNNFYVNADRQRLLVPGGIRVSEIRVKLQ